jgi:hypothetical protein
MKEHAKKALKHDTKVLGKTVPTMLIIGLFLVGGGSAAILSTFGTVSGTADVSQAVIVNGNPAGNGDITSSFSTDVAAGMTHVEEASLNNTANTSIPVSFSTTIEDSPSVEDNSLTKSDDAVTTNYVVVDELVSVDNAQGIETDGDSDIPGDMSSELVYDSEENEVAIHAEGQTLYNNTSSSVDSASYAGAWFDVADTTYTGENDLQIDYRVGDQHRSDEERSGTKPDWVTYEVEDDGVTYYLATFTADIDSGESFNMNSSNVFSIGYANGTTVSDIDSVQSELAESPSAEVERVLVATGSGADDKTQVDMYYHGVSLADNQLFQKSSSAEVSPGVDTLGIIHDFKVGAYPGSYTLDTDVNPGSSS